MITSLQLVNVTCNLTTLEEMRKETNMTVRGVIAYGTKWDALHIICI